MAPTTSNTKNNSENYNPNAAISYSSFTRKGNMALNNNNNSNKSLRQSSNDKPTQHQYYGKAKPTSSSAHGQQRPSTGQHQQQQQHSATTTNETTGIERSYNSISRTISSGNSSITMGASTGNSNSNNQGVKKNNKSPPPPATAEGGKGKTTGIERSYNSVTQTMKYAASFVSNSNNSTKSGSMGMGSTGKGRNEVIQQGGDSSTLGGDSSTIVQDGGTVVQLPPMPVSSVDELSIQGKSISSRRNDDNSTVASKSSTAIGSHIISSLSYDEYTKLRAESRELKQLHEQKYGGLGVSVDAVSLLGDSGGEVEGREEEREGIVSRGLGEDQTNVLDRAINNRSPLRELKSKGGQPQKMVGTGGDEKDVLDPAINNRAVVKHYGCGGELSQQQHVKKKTSGKEFSHSTSTALVINKMSLSSSFSSNIRKEANHRNSSGSASSNGMYSARLGERQNGHHHRSSLDKNMNKLIGKGVVKMTSDSLSKIRNVLHLSNSNDDEMSFYCSDVNTGKVTKQKVSLDGGPHDTLAGEGEITNVISANAKAARGRRIAHEKVENSGGIMVAPPQSVKKFAKTARTSMDKTATHIKNGLGPAIETVTKTALAITKEGVDVMTHDLAPKIGTGLAHTAKVTARNVAKVTQQSVEGVGMMVQDLANAKTPAKSNVTKYDNDYYMNEMFDNQKKKDRYDDYVHDPNYKVVMTPPPQGGGNNVLNAGKTPYHKYCDPNTPAVLVGAVTAGRCNLPGSHPDSLDFLPNGIPSEVIVYDDWEERAGFLPIMNSSSATCATGATTEFAPEAKDNVAFEERRISHPIDVDEETATINGEEVDVEEMLALKEGRTSPKNATSTSSVIKREGFEYDESLVKEDDESYGEDDDGENVEENEIDPRNASMWVAVPDNYMEDDDNASADNYLEKSMCVSDMNFADLLDDDDDDDDVEEEEEYVKVQPLVTPASCGSATFFVGDILVESEEEEEEPLITPASCGSDTFFVGDVHIGFESSPEIKTIRQEVAVEDVASGGDDEEHTANDDIGKVEEDNTVVASVDDDIDGAASKALIEDAKSWTSSPKKEYADRQIASYESASNEEDTLTYLAKATTACVIKHKQQQQLQKEAKEFETPYSVRKGERPLSFTEFKDMNKHVLFDLNNQTEDVAAQQRQGNAEMSHKTLVENYANQQLYLNPSESTELSHEPPVKVVDSYTAQQQLYLNPSESTDLSQFSNWAAPAPTTKKEETAARHSSNSGKRQLKGRLILVRIKKKLSKVAKNMLFVKSKKNGPVIKDGNSFISALPNPKTSAFPISPSGSILSVSSSIMTGSSTKRILGAVPPKNASPTPAQQILYGTINYGNNRSFAEDNSTVAGIDSLPPPPSATMLLPRPKTANSEDVVSYLADAMGRHAPSHNEDDDEDSVLLLVTPKDDGTGDEIVCQVISAIDGTPNVREAIDAGSEDEVANSDVKPNNLASIFTDEKGNGVMYNDTSIQIMDAHEADDGEIVLTPSQVNHNVSDVFRTSIDACSILPGSHLSDDEEEDTLLYHDGNTVIRPSSTFGDNTIVTMRSAKTLEEVTENAKAHGEGRKSVVFHTSDIGTPILSPDGPLLAGQAKANGSFLFSPQNMGRADPSIRAKERALTKSKASITMLPTAAKNKDTLEVRHSYSRSSIDTSSNLPTTSEVSEEAIQKTAENGPPSVNDRQFSFKTILNKFSTDADEHHVVQTSKAAPSPESVLSNDDKEKKTPVVTNAHPKKYPKTPFPEVAAIKSVDSEDSSPLIVSLKNTDSNSPMSSASGFSFKSSSKGGKKKSPKYKNVPKSAARVRKGFVKDRVSDFSQSVDVVSNGATDVNGRLKRNHSYRFKNTRRLTNGNGVLAPRHAVLQTTYIRSVPIALARSRDSMSIDNSFSFGHEEVHKEKKDDTNEEIHDDEEKKIPYASKYTNTLGPLSTTEMTKQACSFDSSSPDSSANSVSDVSETTECDPFSSLLGNVSTSESEDSDEDEDKENVYGRDLDKKNSSCRVTTSPSLHLGFKSGAQTFVKPTEINSHEERAALSPVPMKARSWRVLAAKAQLENNKSQS